MDPIQLPPEIDRAIRKHGSDAFPHECCGFLLGRDQDSLRNIQEALPAENVRGDDEKHNRFTINPKTFMLVEKQIRGSGLEVLGFYHSHPNAPAKPSQYDVDHAWPIYSYVIVSVRDGRPKEMTSWTLQEDRSGFNEQEIVISGT